MMKQYEIAELTGTRLDDAVAMANGWIDYPKDSIEHGSYWHQDPSRAPFGKRLLKSHYTPSTDWSQAGVIIEREGITISKTAQGFWEAYKCPASHSFYMIADSPIIAAMRCHVVSKIGSDLNIPNVEGD